MEGTMMEARLRLTELDRLELIVTFMLSTTSTMVVCLAVAIIWNIIF